jgi:hypothetical protein
VLTSPDRVRRLDVHQIRQVRLAGGVRFWVVPSRRGLCLYSQDPPPWNDTFGGCTVRLAQATGAGNSINLHLRDGKRIVAGVVPDTNQTLRVRTATGTIRSVPVIDGLYVVPTGLRHLYIKSVSATS